MLVKFDQNLTVQATQNFELFWERKKKRVFLNHFWQSVDAILKEVSVAETDYHLSVFQPG